jgi:flagellin-like hook-associated protein FlgL
MSDITLTSSQRQTLLTLTQTNTLFNRTQDRLTSGKKVNNATDDAVAFYRAKSLSDRASDIGDKKAVIDQNISSVTAALTATQAADTMLKSLKAILENARGASLSQRVAATKQFADLGKQLAQLLKDATYQGLNMLTSTSANLSTQFSERTQATFRIDGFNLAATTAGNPRTIFTGVTPYAFSSGGAIMFSNVVGRLLNTVGTVTGFSSLALSGTAAMPGSMALAYYTTADRTIDTAINSLRGITASLGVNVGILQDRSDFGLNYTNSLNTGSDKLTLADLNTESANSQALTLRQNIGIQSLSLSGQQNQAILTLLR